MKHYPVTSREAAQAISRAAWEVAANPTSQTAEALAYQETLSHGWVIDLDPAFVFLVRNPDKISDLVQLMQPAIGEQAAETWEQSLLGRVGDCVSIVDLLPSEIVAGLVDSADLRYPPRPGISPE